MTIPGGPIETTKFRIKLNTRVHAHTYVRMHEQKRKYLCAFLFVIFCAIFMPEFGNVFTAQAFMNAHTTSIIITLILSSHTPSMDLPDSLAIYAYHTSLRAALQNFSHCRYRSILGSFLLVSQHFYVCGRGSIGKSHSWVCPCFSNSDLHAFFVLFQFKKNMC